MEGFFTGFVSNKKNGLVRTNLIPVFYGGEGQDSTETPRERMISWEIIDNEEEMDEFSFVLENDDLALFDSPLFLKGNTIEFQFGYNGNMSETFTGVISSRTGWREMRIAGQFKNEIAITNRQATQKWANKSLRQIAIELFQAEGLIPEVDSTEATNRVLTNVVRNNETVYQFLKRKSGDIEGTFQVYVEGDRGFFVQKKLAQAPSIILKYGTEIIDSDYITIGEPEFTDEQEQTATEETVKGFDLLKKKPIQEKGNNSESSQTSLGQGSYFFDQAIGGFKYREPAAQKSAETGKAKATQKQSTDTAKSEAQGSFDKKNAKAYGLRWTIIGNPKARAKQTIEVECSSKIISGIWYSPKVVHSCTGGAYDTTFEMQRNAQGQVPGTEKATPKGGNNNKKADTEKSNERAYIYDDRSGKFKPKL